VKIVYVGNDKKARRKWEAGTDDILLLLYDRWDDYGFSTRFPTLCRVDGKTLELDAIKILFAEANSSHQYLSKMQKRGWDGVFPIDAENYISVPEDITFYEQLQGATSDADALVVAKMLRDASYLVFQQEEADATKLIDTEGFRNSLQRERGSQKSFADGWKVLSGNALGVSDLSFDFRDVMGELSTLNLNFDAQSVLPHDINVLIGPNGVGKSWLLKQLVRAWILPSDSNDTLDGAGFGQKPNLSQLVAVSYSPFERLPVDADDEPALKKLLQDKDAYRFFGFRGRPAPEKGKKPRKTRHSLVVPRINAATSLISCLTDDLRYSRMKEWANKLDTLQRVLGNAVTFDAAALRLKPEAPIADIIVEDPLDDLRVIELGEEHKEPGTYIEISSRDGVLDVDLLKEHVDYEAGVIFFDGDEPVSLSSGQRLFLYIVVNVIGVIRRNSLVIVDEPELFLHPTLEIEFVAMLKKILRIYGSKAVLATHSAVTVREVPSSCVHVLGTSEDELIITSPPFETFGGDVQRIASYVFGDRAVSKPHESWLRELLLEHGSAEDVIDILGEEINEEIIIQLHAMDNGKW